MPVSPPLKQAVLFLLLLCGAGLACYWIRLPETDAARMNDASLIKARALTDLYPRWYGARESLLHHRDPYSAEVTREIQLAYDGREQRFSYPLYAILFVAPVIGLPFHSAQIVFWWLLAAVTGLSLAVWLSVIPLHLSLLARVTLFAMVFCSVPALQGLRLLQFGLLVAALLSGAVAAIVAGHLFLAGMLLALATIKPPMSLFAICWFAAWTSGDWPRRRTLLQGFAAALAVLIVASECLVPGWLFRYPGVLALYAKHADPVPLISMFLPPSLVWLVALGGLAGTALYCWRVRRQPSNSPQFILAFAFVSTLTVLIIPTALSPYNHLLLLPAVLLILHYWTELWSRGILSRVVISFLAGIALLPWLLAPVAMVALLAPARPWLLNLSLVPLYVSLLLPFAILGFLFLFANAFSSASATNVVPIPTAPRTANI
jgi:hypothetical protein